MHVNLRKMTAAEYERFSAWSLSEYARELMAGSALTREEALLKAEAEQRELLPRDADTPGQSLCVIEADGRGVGFIWYQYEETVGVRQAFLCDLAISPAERGQGLATAALRAMEQGAARTGCEECVLFVADGNEPARRLYAKCGYAPLRRFEHGMYMRRVLAR